MKRILLAISLVLLLVIASNLDLTSNSVTVHALGTYNATEWQITNIPQQDMVDCNSPSARSQCADGTCSTSTGRGTCSKHGGVAGTIDNSDNSPPPPTPVPFYNSKNDYGDFTSNNPPAPVVSKPPSNPVPIVNQPLPSNPPVDNPPSSNSSNLIPPSTVSNNPNLGASSPSTIPTSGGVLDNHPKLIPIVLGISMLLLLIASGLWRNIDFG